MGPNPKSTIVDNIVTTARREANSPNSFTPNDLAARRIETKLITKDKPWPRVSEIKLFLIFFNLLNLNYLVTLY